MAYDELFELEEQGWRALSSTPGEAAAFYGRVLDDEVVMLLPGGLVIDDRAAAIEAMSGQPWSSYRLEEVRVRRPTPDTALVAYGVVAVRVGAAEYSALVGSGYARREAGWRLTFHQQTPR
ncbi:MULTISPECIES: nuclear transport factor 2 family protein [Polymorphospora]|uniref:Nuclear transport factor 2 family protein n=1 Tax=Polymorphospora lycopeni TaxID=3140240 RepID=A0ABV5CM75_9ACTN